MERDAADSARKSLELKNRTLQYPSWWQGADVIEKEKEQVKQTPPQRTVDKAKAKVYKNLNRYAEDSLDARINAA